MILSRLRKMSVIYILSGKFCLFCLSDPVSPVSDIKSEEQRQFLEIVSNEFWVGKYGISLIYGQLLSIK